MRCAAAGTGCAPATMLECFSFELMPVRAPIQDCPPISVSETLAGVPGIVDLWYWLYEPATESALLDACVDLMAEDERIRYTNLRFEHTRCLFLATRILVRTVLSRYVPIPPGEWTFGSEPTGRPLIAQPTIAPAIHFNLANTAGLVVCVVSVAHEFVGVDAERTDRTVDFTGIGERYFSASEAAALRALPGDKIPPRFFEYWTLKESYVKALGVGLALALDQFSFTISGSRISAAFHQRAEDGGHWRFQLVEASPCHIVAVGADTGGADLSLRAEHVMPIGASRRR